jgi:radical SAM protein with 4Fe4S-binding SPASM domain
MIASAAPVVGDAMPLIANLELTNRCNLRCLYCANRRMKRARDDMSVDMLDLVMRRIDEAGIRQVIFNTIGETLVAPHLREALARAKARGLHMLVSTNGQGLIPDMVELLLTGGCDIVRLSVNATDAAAYRRLHRGGSFDTFVANITHLRAERDRLGMPCEIRVRSVLPRDPELRGDLRARLQAVWGGLADEVEFVTFGNMGGRNGSAPLADDRRTRCATMWRGFNVMLDGRIAYCPCDFDGETGIGSIVDHSFREVWGSDAFAAIRRAHTDHDFSQLPRCADCDATRLGWYELKEPRVSEREARIMDEYLAGWRTLAMAEEADCDDSN